MRVVVVVVIVLVVLVMVVAVVVVAVVVVVVHRVLRMEHVMGATSLLRTQQLGMGSPSVSHCLAVWL